MEGKKNNIIIKIIHTEMNKFKYICGDAFLAEIQVNAYNCDTQESLRINEEGRKILLCTSYFTIRRNLNICLCMHLSLKKNKMLLRSDKQKDLCKYYKF